MGRREEATLGKGKSRGVEVGMGWINGRRMEKWNKWKEGGGFRGSDR